MDKIIRIGNKEIGDKKPCFIIAEIGINHNGDLGLAKQLIDMAVEAGCDAVKFQKRDPEVCVPEDQKGKMRDTPWGYISYIDYRYKVEFTFDAYEEINEYCYNKGIMWFASCWDSESVDWMETYFDPPCYKIASPCLTNKEIIKNVLTTSKPIILSTGMSTLEEIDKAVSTIGFNDLVLMHCNSSYPAKAEELNLNVINTLKKRYGGLLIGYSGHETGVFTTLCAVAMGACIVERHITVDRSMWGSDQSASLERTGLNKLVEEIRTFEKARGNGLKQIYPQELLMRKKLRK